MAALLAPALALAACGDDGGTETINSGQAAPTDELIAPTTTAAPDDGEDDQGDHDDDGRVNRRDDEGQFEFSDADVIDCEDDDSPSVSGNGKTVLINGPCREVTISGRRHDVLIESADHVEVSGSDHLVVVKAGDEIDIDGAGHDVLHPPGASVDNTSSDSHVATIPDEDGEGDGSQDDDG